eukprot:m.141590 g.141590  ORF g.141590 m.141590 type:complete len:422 (+) comp24153_c0_seq3:123-1388(+)
MEVLMSGFLMKASQGSAFSKAYKKYYFVLKPGSPLGVARLEYFEDANTSTSPKGVIPVKNCTSCNRLKVYKKFKEGAFELITPERTYILIAANNYFMDQWVDEIASLVFNTPAETKSSRPLPAPPSSNTGPPVVHTLQENEVYGASDEDVFQVDVQTTADAERLNIIGPATLVVSSVNLTLLSRTTGQTMAVFPLRYLRRYGRDLGFFSFECGRKTSTGPGVFYLASDDCAKIFRVVDRHEKSMAASNTSLHSRSSQAHSIRTLPQDVAWPKAPTLSADPGFMKPPVLRADPNFAQSPPVQAPSSHGYNGTITNATIVKADPQTHSYHKLGGDGHGRPESDYSGIDRPQMANYDEFQKDSFGAEPTYDNFGSRASQDGVYGEPTFDGPTKKGTYDNLPARSAVVVRGAPTDSYFDVELPES